MTAEKLSVRSLARAARRHFTAHHHEPWQPAALPPAIIAALPAVALIGSYVPIGSEADPQPLTTWFAANGATVALPCLREGAAQMTFSAWQEQMPLVRSASGFRQPSDADVAVIPAVVLCPLVAFDAGGNRIGQGGGHYDRWFAANPTVLRIGIAWAVQQQLPWQADRWDMPLDAIVTEKNWIVPPSSRIAA